LISVRDRIAEKYQSRTMHAATLTEACYRHRREGSRIVRSPSNPALRIRQLLLRCSTSGIHAVAGCGRSTARDALLRIAQALASLRSGRC
jgi:hypothetical protein